MDQRASAIDTLRSAGWLYEPASALASPAPAPLEGADASVKAWAASFSSLSSADETTWFLATADYGATDADEFVWNEFEAMSLEAASSDDERASIIDFWTAHVPILLSVRGHYRYLAVRHDGAVVYGEEPEFEQSEVIAPDLASLLDMIITRHDNRRLESLSLV